MLELVEQADKKSFIRCGNRKFGVNTCKRFSTSKTIDQKKKTYRKEKAKKNKKKTNAR